MSHGAPGELVLDNEDMSERHAAPSEAEQQVVFDLVQERLLELFGPGGSFSVTVGRARPEDGIFVSTISEMIAHDVATAFNPPTKETAGRRAARDAQVEHASVWERVDADLKIASSGPNAFLDSLDTLQPPARETLVDSEFERTASAA